MAIGEGREERRGERERLGTDGASYNAQEFVQGELTFLHVIEPSLQLVHIRTDPID